MSSSARAEVEFAGLDLGRDLVEAAGDLLALFLGDDAGRASIAAWALDARISWRQRRLSKSMEAFISSMIAAGDAKKRPPHMVLVTSVEPWSESR